MSPSAKKISLTQAHIARVHRLVEPDGGPIPGFEPQTDADYAAWVNRIIQSHPTPARPTRLFAYGSLIWKPEIEHVDEQRGSAHGWHRAFCFRRLRYRGTPEQPGLSGSRSGGSVSGCSLHPSRSQSGRPT